MDIEEISPEEAPLELLLEADPSIEQIQSYLPSSRCYAAREGDEIIGVAVLLPRSQAVYELMNIATRPDRQGQGVGSALLRQLIAHVRAQGVARLEVGTGTFGYQLRFYQRAGFRVYAVDRDFFLKHYAEPIFEDGLQHMDMLRLAVDL